MDSVQLSAPVYETPAQKQKKKGISGSTIKIIAVVTMLIDHVAAALLTRMLISRGLLDISMSGDYVQIMQWIADNAVLYYGMSAMRMIGRLGFPIFCFLLVEGFQKTRNIKKEIATEVLHFFSGIPPGRRNDITNNYMLEAFRYVLPLD